MTFAKTVAAYLTGWLIVQPIYNRLFGVWRRRELGDPGPETQAYFRRQAEAIVDEMEARRPVLHEQAREAIDAIVHDMAEIVAREGGA